MYTPSKLTIPDLARRRTLLAMCAGMGLGAAACGPREAAPRFDYTLLDGTRRASEVLRGQVVLVNFWATSCATCVHEMPQFAATHRRFAGRGFETLAVSMAHDAPARVSDFAQQRRLPFGVVIDNTGAIARAFGNVRITPTTFVIDKRGAVAFRTEGAPDFPALHALVERLLAEAA